MGVLPIKARVVNANNWYVAVNAREEWKASNKNHKRGGGRVLYGIVGSPNARQKGDPEKEVEAAWGSQVNARKASVLTAWGGESRR